MWFTTLRPTEFVRFIQTPWAGLCSIRLARNWFVFGRNTERLNAPAELIIIIVIIIDERRVGSVQNGRGKAVRGVGKRVFWTERALVFFVFLRYRRRISRDYTTAGENEMALRSRVRRFWVGRIWTSNTPNCARPLSAVSRTTHSRGDGTKRCRSSCCPNATTCSIRTNGARTTRLRHMTRTATLDW